MERKISDMVERRLTHAIEKAASLALVQPEADRSRLLADILLKDDVENAFAKTAAAAFNRRLTVLKFQKTADEHKAETFPLADPEQVLGYMGGSGEMPKVAAEMTVQQGPFEMTVTRYDDGTIVKTAKAEVTRPLYEDTVTYPHFEAHIESMMHLHEANFSRKMGELYKMAGEVDAERSEVLDELAKVGSFEWRTLCNVFGDRLEAAIGDAMPEGTDFSKTASVVNPHTPLFEKVAKLLDDMDEYVEFNNMLVDYKNGLAEMGKTAAGLSTQIRKTAAEPSTYAGMGIRTIVGATGTAVNALEHLRQTGGAALEGAYNQAFAMNRAGTDIDVSPAKLLDADFLVKDRYRDRLLAWSDMSADPVLSKYDPEELFMAVQKAMDTVPALERPDQREMLRTYVSQLLPQNGRQSLADLSALATTEKALAASPGTLQSDAAAVVEGMPKETAPQVDVPNALSTALNITNKIDGSVKIDAEKLIGASKEDLKEDKEKEKEIATAEKTTRDARIKAMAEYMKTMNIFPQRDAYGHITGYYLNNTHLKSGAGKIPAHVPISEDDIIAGFNQYIANQSRLTS